MESKIRIPILMYHHIGKTSAKKDKPFFVSSKRFEKQMNFLRKEKFQSINLDDLIEFFRNGRLFPHKPIVITFDDGSESIYTQAFPVLRKYNFKATAFLTANYLDGREMIEKSFLKYPPLRWEQIREMQAYGFSFGSHSLSHPRLSKIAPPLAEHEIRKSKEILESKLDKRIDFFAYPYGDLNHEVEKMVKNAGYVGAVWAWGGVNRSDSDIFKLKRIAVFDQDTNLQLKLKLAFATDKVTPPSLVHYYWLRVLYRFSKNVAQKL